MPASMNEEDGTQHQAPEADAQADKMPDPYAMYPLPYVIGTVEFHDDDYCGIHASSEGTHGHLFIPWCSCQLMLMLCAIASRL
jgi:hypothetical protein